MNRKRKNWVRSRKSSINIFSADLWKIWIFKLIPRKFEFQKTLRVCLRLWLSYSEICLVIRDQKGAASVKPAKFQTSPHIYGGNIKNAKPVNQNLTTDSKAPPYSTPPACFNLNLILHFCLVYWKVVYDNWYQKKVSVRMTYYLVFPNHNP